MCSVVVQHLRAVVLTYHFPHTAPRYISCRAANAFAPCQALLFEEQFVRSPSLPSSHTSSASAAARTRALYAHCVRTRLLLPRFPTHTPVPRAHAARAHTHCACTRAAHAFCRTSPASASLPFASSSTLWVCVHFTPHPPVGSLIGSDMDHPLWFWHSSPVVL